MAGIAFQFRRTTDVDNLQDQLYDGEPIFGTSDYTGLAIGKSNQVYKNWHISKTEGKYKIPYDFTLGKKLVDDRVSNIHIDWRSPNIMIFSNLSGSLQPMIIGSDGQYVRLAPDSLINRGAPSSLESFVCGIDNISYQVSPSNSKKAYSYGNLLFDTADNTLVDTTVKVRNLDSSSMRRYVRNSGTVSNPHFFKQGRFTIKKNTARRFILDSTLKSYMYYPGAANMPLTFYMLYEVEGTNTLFNTRIGIGNSFSQFQTSILNSNSSPLLGAVAFYYDPALMDTSDLNSGKPMFIEWIRDAAMYGSGSLSEVRGISVSMLSVFYGHIPVNQINPAFNHLSRENSHAKLYNTGVQSHSLLNRNVNFVNFKTPLISANYDIDITSNYAIQVLAKSRAGFRYQCLSLPVNTTSSFTYAARVNGT